MNARVSRGGQASHLVARGGGGGGHRYRLQAGRRMQVHRLVDSSNAVGQEYRVAGVPTVYLLEVDGKVEASATGMPAAWEVVQQFQTDR